MIWNVSYERPSCPKAIWETVNSAEAYPARISCAAKLTQPTHWIRPSKRAPQRGFSLDLRHIRTLNRCLKLKAFDSITRVLHKARWALLEQAGKAGAAKSSLQWVWGVLPFEFDSLVRLCFSYTLASHNCYAIIFPNKFPKLRLDYFLLKNKFLAYQVHNAGAFPSVEKAGLES